MRIKIVMEIEGKKIKRKKFSSVAALLLMDFSSLILGNKFQFAAMTTNDCGS